jgi:hypothetical protein
LAAGPNTRARWEWLAWCLIWGACQWQEFRPLICWLCPGIWSTGKIDGNGQGPMYVVPFPPSLVLLMLFLFRTVVFFFGAKMGSGGSCCMCYCWLSRWKHAWRNGRRTQLFCKADM